MKRFGTLASTFVTGIALAVSASADDQALIIANKGYYSTTSGPSTELATRAANKLQQAGYRVSVVNNANLSELNASIDGFAGSALPRDHVVYVFLGHVLNDGNQAYLTPVSLSGPTAETIDQSSYPVSELLEKASQHSGASAVFLGWSRVKRKIFGAREYGFRGSAGLSGGTGVQDVPQGVLLVDGRDILVSNAIESHYFEPNRSTKTVAEALSGQVRSQGFLSLHAYLERAGQEQVEEPEISIDIEEAFFNYAKEENSIEVYTAFLNKYPNGKYSTSVRTTLLKLKAEAKLDPNERIENALNLSKDDRKNIQRALTVLGFDTKGVDGIFGPSSRSAIKRWQAKQRFASHGFLDGAQQKLVLRLGVQKRREIAAEEKRKREEEAKSDRLFWKLTGLSGEEEDLRLYLDKYPKGIYAQEATSKLKQLRKQKVQEFNPAAEILYWRKAVQVNTIDGYRDYLRRYQRGMFSVEAKNRIRALSKDDKRALSEQAKKTEASLNIKKPIWLIIELKLSGLGYQIEKVDGVVDKGTRKAIRGLQEANNLPVTGFMDRETLALRTFK